MEDEVDEPTATIEKLVEVVLEEGGAEEDSVGRCSVT